jgi:hypothetical protein
VDLPGPLASVSRRVGSAMGGFAQDVADTVVPLAVDAVDINELVERVDIDALLDKFDVNRLLERVDLDTILDRVDLDRLVARLDMDAILERVDLDAVLMRVDVNELVKRIDIDEVVARSDLEAIVTRSTSGLASHAVDTVRSQGVGLDGFVHRWVDRLLGRSGDRPVGPPALVAPKSTP